MVYKLNGLSEKLFLKQSHPKITNISIVKYLRQSKNESSGSQDHT